MRPLGTDTPVPGRRFRGGAGRGDYDSGVFASIRGFVRDSPVFRPVAPSLGAGWHALDRSRLVYDGRRARLRRRADRARPLGLRVAFTPEMPLGRHLAYQLCVRLDAPLADPADADVVVYWQDTTVRGPRPAEVGPRAINAGVSDIGKHRVHAWHPRVFGYGLEPPPDATQVLEKSNRNSQHDGRVVAGPSGSPDRVAERVIDTRFSATVVEEHRAVIMGERVVLVTTHFELRHRFKEPALLSIVVDPDETFSPAEQDRLVAFCRAGGADYADLDVLRDRDTGRLYVVDFNPTPAGPPRRLLAADRPRWWHDLEEGWRELLRSHAG